MKKTFSALAGFWRRSRISLSLAAVLILGVVFFGLHDVGLVLGYLATAIIMIELTRRWRKIRYFVILAFASILGIVFLAFLHEIVVAPLVSRFTGAGADNSLGFRIFSDVVSLAIIFIGLMGILTGMVGAIILGIWRLAALIKKKVKTEAKT